MNIAGVFFLLEALALLYFLYICAVKWLILGRAGEFTPELNLVTA